MRRVETYVGQQVYEWLFSADAQNTMTAIAKVCSALFGTSGIVNGLACGATSPASMAVQIGAGEVYQMAALEATACGTLPANTSSTILKQGIQLGTYTTTAFAAPTTTGQSINYLIEAQYQDSDISLDPTTGNTNVVLQFYNAANPTTPWSGPANSGATSNTFRDGIVAYQIKSGGAATTGTQATPSPDTGWIGLWVVTIAYGQTTITSASIAPYNGSPVLASPILTQVQQSPSVVGSMRNLTMSVTTASASASLSADEIVVESALGGNTYKLASFAKVINLATTGAGGMDTGSAPTSGFVAIYAIYNPTTATAALLATNATSAAQPNVYGGANMPSGYTASALVTVVPTNSSSQFVATFVQDRKVSINQVQVLSQGFTAASAVTSLSIAGAVPKNAKRVGGSLSQSTSTAANFVWLFFASTVGIGEQQYSVNTTGGGGNLFAYSGLDLSTAQTLVYQVQTISAGTGTAVLFVSSYEI
jgi:hypothetical protein